MGLRREGQLVWEPCKAKKGDSFQKKRILGGGGARAGAKGDPWQERSWRNSRWAFSVHPWSWEQELLQDGAGGWVWGWFDTGAADGLPTHRRSVRRIHFTLVLILVLVLVRVYLMLGNKNLYWLKSVLRRPFLRSQKKQSYHGNRITHDMPVFTATLQPKCSPSFKSIIFKLKDWCGLCSVWSLPWGGSKETF